MSIFRGKNKFKKIQGQVYHKALFQRRAYRAEGPEVFEFNFLEYSMYGAVDNDGSSIVPNLMPMANFRRSPRDYYSYQAFDFVTDMYIDVKRNIQLAIQLGHLPNDNEFLSTMEIKRAFEHPGKKYENYLGGILLNFNRKILNERRLSDNITSFSDYVKELMTFLKENYVSMPITFSSWLQSSQNSIFSTGLAFSVADIPFDDDNRKYDEFMISDIFSFYKKALLNRGFRIWKHCPYVLVADLGSPAITKYTNRSANSVIEENYTKSYLIDYRYLFNIIIEYYNYLVFEQPYVIELKLGCVRRTDKEFRYRPEKSPSDIDHFFWMNYYLDLRNIETGYPKEPSEMNKIKRYMKNMKNSFDNSQILGYINNNFKKETFKKSFGLSHEYSRMLERERLRKLREGITGGSTIVGGSGGTSSGGY